MTRRIPRLLIAGSSLLCSATAAVAGGLQTLPIDSEQVAVSSFITATHTATESQYHQVFLMDPVITYSMRALQTAGQVTTPAALMATPAGITVACETSGNMTARMAPRTPRVFKFEWHDCHFPQYGADQSLDGPGEIVLLSDSFTPDRAASIRLGSATRDFVQGSNLVTPNWSSRNNNLRNLLVVGSIPMRNLQLGIPGLFTPFTYVVNGFGDFSQTNQSGTDPEYTVSSRLDLDAVTYTGSESYNDDGSRYTTDLTVLLGKLTFTRRDPPPYGTTSDIYRYQGFRVRNTIDFPKGEYTQSIDGRLNFTWSPNFGAGCHNGSYEFRTKVPLHQVSSGFYRPYDSGDLVINDTAELSFYSAANVPASLPTPANLTLLHIDAAGVGTFDYDINDVQLDLRPISHCM